ncbi:MAG: ribonuclease III [Thermodesulfovibrionales bacterium]|jgi:ribonuclease-3|nr:ribonuclease III [Thermodesulfovibrionales bacterium]
MVEHTITELENVLGYSFKNRQILMNALTHRSFFHENPDKAQDYNERLEFLGDSVLGFVIVEYLYLSDSSLTESIMAKAKSYLVKESVLSEIAASLSLGKYLRLGKGEESTGGRTKRSLLADGVEAVLGAVYLDGGYEDARRLILGLFQNKIGSVLMSGEFYDFKTELQEKTQLLFNSIPEYRMIKQEGEEHNKIFTVDVHIAGTKFGTGFGKSKKEAETNAAQEALRELQTQESREYI